MEKEEDAKVCCVWSGGGGRGREMLLRDVLGWAGEKLVASSFGFWNFFFFFLHTVEWLDKNVRNSLVFAPNSLSHVNPRSLLRDLLGQLFFSFVFPSVWEKKEE